MFVTKTKKLPNMMLKKGAVVYSVNDPSDCVYLVKVGAVQIETKYGMILGELGEGELFGEVGLITNELRTVTVKAKVDSVIIKIDEPTFLEKLQQADPVCNAIIRGLALRISDANGLAEKYWRELSIYKSIDGEN
ncbi:cyclic nucleotide-binding domain-containing protein [Alphaproteobacteria bacterium]|nr:cyclic nucleotide-binding domain-containing protein [Alphaproteobacteria bacterium]